MLLGEAGKTIYYDFQPIFGDMKSNSERRNVIGWPNQLRFARKLIIKEFGSELMNHNHSHLSRNQIDLQPFPLQSELLFSVSCLLEVDRSGKFCNKTSCEGRIMGGRSFTGFSWRFQLKAVESLLDSEGFLGNFDCLRTENSKILRYLPLCS